MKTASQSFRVEGKADHRGALRVLPAFEEGNATTLPLETTIVNPVSEPLWDEWISTHQDATIFHSSAWARVLVDTYHHFPCYLRFAARGSLVALVPMMEVSTLFTRTRGLCLPFSDYCPPLLSSSFGGDLVLKKLRQIGRERSWNYFELRDSSLLPEEAAISESYFGHTLDLSAGGTELTANFHSSVRRALRKAEQNRLTTSVRTTAEAMEQFYRLHLRTRRKHGVPPQPRAFFSNIQKHIIAPGRGFIVTVEYGSNPIASAMFFTFGRRAIYKFGASDERWQHLRGNNLAMAVAIKHLANGAFKTLDFGRTDKANAGLRRFKLSFGGCEREISYGKFSVSSDTWVRSRQPTWPNRLFRFLPAPVNGLAGVMLYPHLD